MRDGQSWICNPQSSVFEKLPMSATDLSAVLSNSLSLSSILVLTAVGLAITFGVMRVINMAHGDMMMLGAYTAYLIADSEWLRSVHLNNLWVAIPASFLVVGLFGYLLEVCLIRFLYHRPLDTLLATWGVGLVLQQAVRLWISADNHLISEPAVLSFNIPVAGASFEAYRAFMIVF